MEKEFFTLDKSIKLREKVGKKEVSEVIKWL